MEFDITTGWDRDRDRDRDSGPFGNGKGEIERLGGETRVLTLRCPCEMETVLYRKIGMGPVRHVMEHALRSGALLQ
jgi:hypothetical protein